MARFVLTAELSLQAPRNVAQVVQQIQSQLNGVQVNVQVQGARQAQRDVEQLARSADRANDSFFRMGRTFTASIRRFSALAIATRAVSLLTNTLGSAIEEAISFQNEVVRLSQVTGDSISKLSGLTNEITNLATTLGVSSDKLLSVTTILAQAGLTASDTRVALAALAKTELAPTFGNITETAEGAIAILAQFKLGAGALEAQLGSLNAVSGKFAVESGDLVEVIRRTGGVFKSAGGDLNELIALFTSVRATTRESASTIATGLRTIFTRIQRPKTIEYLKQYGVELVDLEGKFVGPFEAVKRLSEALAGLEEGDITFVQIAEQLGGFRQIGKVIPLLREFALSQEALKVAQEGTGSLTRDQATAQLSLAVQITKVKEQFFALVRGFTETTTFRVMADVILKLASTFIRLAEAVQPILPLLTAFAGIRLAQGIGGLIGGVLGRARGMSQGGKVLGFAKGGLVPGSGSGTADDIPAMVSGGEFVMKKSAVQRIGADTLTAMNENRFATGGIIALNPYDKGSPDTAIRKSGEIKVADVAERAGIPTDRGYRERFTQAASASPNKELALLAKSGKLNVDAVGLSIGDENVASETESQIKDSFAKLINNSSGALASKFDVAKPSKQITTQDLELFGINGVIGNAFEAMLTTLGAPFDAPPQDEMQKAVNKANNNSAFDYPSGLRSLGKGNLSALSDIPTDAKRTVTGREVNEIITKKYPNLLADAAKQAMSSIKGKELSSLQSKESGYRTEDLKAYGIRSAKDLEALGWTSPFRGKWNPPVTKNLGGLIQKFAIGGRAKGIQDAPLVDDILQASGSILPRPSAAIQALINAGGGAVDVDRTLKRTIGDTAYAKAPTPEAKNASLDTYFRDEAKRLQDLKTAPITQFGKELQAAIKSRQLDARKISIISKSKRVKGAAEYLSSQFGIPVQNMIFTQGGSKQPAIDAIRTKGSRVDRVKKFSGGLIQKFAQGGTPSPLDSLQEYYTDAAPMNLGLADSKNLGKDQRQKLASNVRGLRKLRTPAPATLYSSISRVAFDKMASQVGFNKAPTIPEGTKYNDIEKILDKEAKQTIGKAFNLPGFVSTSKDYAKAKTFLDNAPRSEDNWAAMLTIATKANAQGVDVEKQLSGRQLNITKQDINPRTGKMETMYMKPPSSEEEVILQPRSRFRISEARAVKLGTHKNLWATAQQFASGGVVPGVGNRDTVPAMLNEGDFVIRKSSTQNIGTDVLSSMAGYAAGGSVSKGVPALLTPGEFVFSQEEAQGIGYGKLNKMNKVGKYATGGYVGVQRFAGGTSGKGAKSSDNAIEKLVLPNLGKVDQAGLKLASVLDKFSFGTFSKFTLGINSLYSSFAGVESLNQQYQRHLIYLNSVLPGFSNILSDNKKANNRSNVMQGELVVQLGSMIKNLQAQGVSQSQLRGKVNKLVKDFEGDTQAKTKTTSSKPAPTPVAPIGPVVTSPTAPSSPATAVHPDLAAYMGGQPSDPTTTTNPNAISPESKQVTDRSAQLATALAAAGTAMSYFQSEITENSSTMAIFTNNVLSSIQSVTLVGAALQAFGVSLGRAAIAANLDSLFKAVPALGKQFESFKISTTDFASGLQGAAIAATAVVVGFNILMSTLQESARLEKERQMKLAVASDIGSEQQKQAMDKAGASAGSEASSGVRNTFGTVGGIIGGIIGGVSGALTGGAAGAAGGTVALPVIGTVGGAGVGATVGGAVGGAKGAAVGTALGVVAAGLLGYTEEASVLAESQNRIATAKLIADKEMATSSKAASQALKDFQDGTATAADVLKSTQGSGQAISMQIAETKKANEAEKSLADNSGNTRAWMTLGYSDSKEEKQKKSSENSKIRDAELKKAVDGYIEMNQAGTSALARANAATGQSFDDFFTTLQTTNQPLADAYASSEENLERLKKEFKNISDEAERTRKAFVAMNLGFQSVDATAAAMTVGLENYLASQQAGNVGLTQSISTLQAGLTNAAQGITTEAFQSALTDASAALTAMGAGDEEVGKFTENMSAINKAQKFYASATQDAKENLQAEFKRGAAGQSDPKKRQEALSDAITSQLEGSGVDKKVTKRIGEALAGAKIADGDLEAIIDGNFEVLDKVLKDVGDKTFGQVSKSLEQYAKYQQQLVKLTQERIQVEGKLRDAQKSTIDATLEAAKIAQEFGGAAVTPDQNRKAIIDKANIDARDFKDDKNQPLDLGQLKTGSAEEIKARQVKIREALTARQNIKLGAADTTNKGAQKALQGQGGAQLSADTERLKQLAQENYNTTKALIDQKREEIKLIQSKNQLEKDSMDALISGDIMKFFDSQAAIGAQAALATGDQQLISQFDTASLGAATKDLERQKEAGVQQKFGRDIGGAGGLVESGFSAIGGRVGLGQDAIQAAAQTTPEQLQAEKEARELAGTLPENMSILEMSAQTDLDAANKQLEAAELQLKVARGEVEKSAAGPVKPAAGLARGGTVYASRGTFVNFKPKGTDTVPAMLTPGEFVVRRQSVQRGNNLAILTAMNKGQTAPSATGAAAGMAKGGQVKYMNTGGIAPQGSNSGVSINVDVQALKSFSESLSKFNSDLATNIQNLKDTQFKISLSPTNINVNLTGTSFLEQLTSSLKQELISYVGSAISQYTVGSDGKLKKSGSTLGTGL